MPIIREYDQQLRAPNRPISQSADPGMAGAAFRGMAALGKGISDVGEAVFDIAEQHEMTQLQVATAKARAELTAKMQRAKETGEAADPEYVKYATEAAEELSASLAENMSTRRGTNSARVMGAQLAASVQTQAIHDNANAIGEQARLTALETQNINRMTLASSPQQFAAVLGETRAHIDSLTNIDSNVRQRMRIEAEDGLATAAIQGVIRTRSPEEAKQILDDRHFDGFLSADSKRSLYAEADQAIRAREAEAIRLEAHQRKLDEKAREETKTEFVGLMNTPNGNQLSVKQILASNLLSAEKEHFIHALKDGPAAKADPGVVNRLFHDMYREEGDPKKITDPVQLVPYVGKGLDLTALNHLTKAFKDVPLNKDVGRAMATARMAFRGSKVGAALPDVAELATMDWSRDLRAAMEQYRAEGKDPNLLLSRDPAVRESFLNPTKMSSYLRPAQLLTAEQAANAGAPEVGAVVKHGDGNYKFKGGNPADQKAWERVP